MKNKITIILDENTCQSLHKMFKDDDEAILRFAVKAINSELDRCRSEQSSTQKKSDGLEGYLQSGKTGSRDYGIKGQGW